jgi:preprotein translocase subunit YajC
VSYPLILLLADGPKNTGPDFGKASPVGLLVVVLLLIAVFALVWSMNRHLKKAREHFDAVESGSAAGTAAGTVAPVDSGSAGTREPSGESGG